MNISLQNNLPLLTEDPILIKSEQNERSGNYILFGDWPQSLKKDDVSIDESRVYKINSWSCYLGSDNCYYVKETAHPFIIEGDVFFTNKEVIENGRDYFFKLESIKWRILDENSEKGKLLLCDKALLSYLFDTHVYYDENENDIIEKNRLVNEKNIYANNYEYSAMRAFLNGLDGSSYDENDYSMNGFINKAFTKKAIERINTVTVDNSSISTTDCDNNIPPQTKYISNDTKDKIFLLSQREVTDKKYSFDSFDKEILSRSIECTDYSLATGTYANNQNKCTWWLRSPIEDIVMSMQTVFFNGSTNNSSNCVDNSDVAIVPAFYIV